MTRLARLLSLVALALLTSAAPVTADDRPNILLVTADDLGNQLSCYGDTRLATPHLDRLAAEGVRFTRAYVAQSSCSSSRAALLTGLYPHQNGQYGLSHLGFRMHPGNRNLVAMLKKAGYWTGIVGKLHVEPAGEFPFDWKPEGKGTSAGPTRDVRWVAKQAREFFASSGKSGGPRLLYVNYFDPHGPYFPEVAQVAGLPEKPLDPESIEPLPMGRNPQAARRLTALFYDCVARVDLGMGMLLDELKAAGLAENTLVIFLGDNGAPVRRGKTSSYERGVQVPLLIRWPGKARPGEVRDELVSAVDVMPTVLLAAGVAVPEELAGRALQPLLSAEASPEWRRYLFTEMSFHTANHYKPQRSVRDDRYKLLLNLAPRGEQAAVELFDLKSDPGETKNLADDPSCAEHRQRLTAALRAWQKDTGDPLADPARASRWKQVADKWEATAPRRGKGPYPDVARVPEGELKLLE